MNEHDTISMTVEQLAMIIHKVTYKKWPYLNELKWDIEPEEERECFLQYAVEYYQEVVEGEAE